jgi:enterochelin esterase-like enzyme
LVRLCDQTRSIIPAGQHADTSTGYGRAVLRTSTTPWWLTADRVPGRRRRLVVHSRPLRARIQVVVWSPTGATGPLPLLVAHDGPEYDRQAGLTRYAAAAIAAGELPPHRIALLEPGDRNEWYSAAALYTRALCTEVLPALPSAGRAVGMGASLGALAMLHAQRRYPGSFAALFLQSGSFFQPRFDAHESGFPRYQRVVRFVRGVQTTWGPASGDHSATASPSVAASGTPEGMAAQPVPVTLTCGGGEENVRNNRVMARSLAGQGYDAALYEVAGMHDFTAWRNALDPHLTRLLRRMWIA